MKAFSIVVLGLKLHFLTPVFYIYYLGLQEEGAKDIKRRLKSAIFKDGL